MNHVQYTKKPGFQCFLAAFILGLILLSRDSMYGLTVFGFLPSHIAMGAMTAILAAVLLIADRKCLKAVFLNLRMAAAGLVILLFLLPMVLKRDWQLMYISVPFYICIAILLSYFTDTRQVSRYYLMILSALAVYSILTTYVLRILPDRGILPVPTFLNNGGFSFYQFGLSVVSREFVPLRNFGIFREPGVYQFFLLLGLFLNNYVAQWEKPWQLWTVNGILALTMLTTFATGGIIEMGLLGIVLFFDRKWYRSRAVRIALYCALGTVAAFVAWVLITKNFLYEELISVFGKFFWDIPPEESRTYAIKVDLGIFLRHPLLGDSLFSVLHATPNNTSSTMIQYAGFGLVTGSLHVALYGALAWSRQRKWYVNLCLLVILLMSFNTQNLIGNPMFWLFPVLAALEKWTPALENRLGKKGEQ